MQVIEWKAGDKKKGTTQISFESSPTRRKDGVMPSTVNIDSEDFSLISGRFFYNRYFNRDFGMLAWAHCHYLEK